MAVLIIIIQACSVHVKMKREREGGDFLWFFDRHLLFSESGNDDKSK